MGRVFPAAKWCVRKSSGVLSGTYTVFVLVGYTDPCLPACAIRQEILSPLLLHTPYSALGIMRTKTYRGGIERTKNHGVSLSGHITMVFIIDTEADWARRIPSPGTFRINAPELQSLFEAMRCIMHNEPVRNNPGSKHGSCVTSAAHCTDLRTAKSTAIQPCFRLFHPPNTEKWHSCASASLYKIMNYWNMLSTLSGKYTCCFQRYQGRLPPCFPFLTKGKPSPDIFCPAIFILPYSLLPQCLTYKSSVFHIYLKKAASRLFCHPNTSAQISQLCFLEKRSILLNWYAILRTVMIF